MVTFPLHFILVLQVHKIFKVRGLVFFLNFCFVLISHKSNVFTHRFSFYLKIYRPGPTAVQVQIMGGKYEVNINDFYVGELKKIAGTIIFTTI